MYFSHLGVSLISVKPLTTENTENKTTPKICKITVFKKKLTFQWNLDLKKLPPFLPLYEAIEKGWNEYWNPLLFQ